MKNIADRKMDTKGGNMEFDLSSEEFRIEKQALEVILAQHSIVNNSKLVNQLIGWKKGLEI